MNTETKTTSNRESAIRALAGVGVVALILVGMTIAVYTARYIPAVVSSIGQAAVSMTSIFTPAKPSKLEVVNTGTVLPFDTSVTATSTATTTATTTGSAAATTTVTTKNATPTAGAASESAYVIPGSEGTSPNIANNTLYGQSDLTTTNVTVGYLPLNSSSDSDFVPSQTVPAGTRFAVKFTVTNQGTNTTGNWDFSAQLPTNQSYTFHSPTQQALNPGDRIDFMLHLDAGQARTGTNQVVTITLDPNKNVSESNENNNFASASVSINN